MTFEDNVHKFPFLKDFLDEIPMQIYYRRVSEVSYSLPVSNNLITRGRYVHMKEMKK